MTSQSHRGRSFHLLIVYPSFREQAVTERRRSKDEEEKANGKQSYQHWKCRLGEKSTWQLLSITLASCQWSRWSITSRLSGTCSRQQSCSGSPSKWPTVHVLCSSGCRHASLTVPLQHNIWHIFICLITFWLQTCGVQTTTDCLSHFERVRTDCALK